MFWDNVLFLVFPYFAFVLFIVGIVFRFWKRPFSVSSLSSQLLERRKLYWGIIAWHWSIVLVLFAHLLNFLLPNGMAFFESLRVGLFMAQILGSGFGLLTIFGMSVLIYRRISDPRVWVTTTILDLVVVFSLLFQIVAGTVMRIGLYDAYHYWFPQFFDPYFASIFTFNPQPELITGLPWLAQAHVFDAMLLLALLPYSRLIHIAALPLGYLVRPWLVFMREKRQPPKLTES
jgi:nitrate reductase gamma subunit